MAARSSVDLDSDPRAIVTTREIGAPRMLVFEAWTDPAHLSQWWGPDGFTTTTSSFDLRTGGTWRFVMHGPDGRNYDNLITYEVIERPSRLVYRHGDGDDSDRFHTTVTFEEIDGNRTRITLQAVFPSAAERDLVIKNYGAVKGAEQTLARLAGYVAARS